MRVLILSLIFIFGSMSLFATNPSSTFHLCDRTGCEQFSTTVTMSEFVKVGDCMVEVFYDLWNCPEDVFTFNIKGFNLDCNGTPPSNADIMKAVKKYLLTISHPLSHNGDINPSNFKVEILAPSCYYLEALGGGKYYADRNENFTKGKSLPCTYTCCSNTYTLNATTYPYQLFVSNVERSTNTSTSSTCSEIPNYCQNACSEDEIVEGPITLDYLACGLPGQETSYLFGDKLETGYSPTRDYMSVVDGSIIGSNYYVQPRAIIGISSSGVTNATDMKNYIRDLIHKRTSVFNVAATDVMYLYINQCWSNYDGTAYPCSEPCCQFKIEFTGNIIHINQIVAGSSTCSDPCFDVCDEILTLNNQPITNAKQTFEMEDNPNINEDLKIIPNPSSGLTNIQYKSETNGIVEIQIMTLDGQVVGIRKLAKVSKIMNYELNAKAFSNGTYFVKIILNGQQQITRKIIIQN